METDVLEYALAAIFLIIIKENEIHPVTFHSCTFRATELNYDMYDKKLLIVFKAFYM